MACASCKGSASSSLSTNSGNSCGSCSKRQVMDTEKPLEQIKNGDKNFCFTEITDEICENLANDEGIHPSVKNSNNDCDDLTALNDLGIGDLNNHLIPLNMCDVEAWKCWLFSLLSWMWNINKAIICAICGLWKKLHELEDIIFSVIKFDYTILDPHVELHLQKGEITNAGFVDVRLELTVTSQIPAGMYKIAKINEPKAQPMGSIINGVTIESIDYELFGSAAIRDEFIYMNTTKTIPAGKVLHYSFAYRNFTPKK